MDGYAQFICKYSANSYMKLGLSRNFSIWKGPGSSHPCIARDSLLLKHQKAQTSDGYRKLFIIGNFKTQVESQNLKQQNTLLLERKYVCIYVNRCVCEFLYMQRSLKAQALSLSQFLASLVTEDWGRWRLLFLFYRNLHCLISLTTNS